MTDAQNSAGVPVDAEQAKALLAALDAAEEFEEAPGIGYGEHILDFALIRATLARIAALEAHIAAEPDRMREVAERSDAAQLNLYRQAERDREARRRADEAFDLIAPFVAKFAAAASHYDGGRPRFEGAAHFFHDADPSYGCALTSTATGIGGPGAPQSPTLGDLRLLAAAYQQATAIRAQEIKP